MANDKGSQDAAMARAKAQADQVKLQEQTSTAFVDGTETRPTSISDANKAAEVKSKFAQGYQMEGAGWQKPSTPTNKGVEAVGQTLSQQGATQPQSQELSPDRASHIQNMLDKGSQRSGNEPSLENMRDKIGSVREGDKTAETSKASEPEMER